MKEAYYGQYCPCEKATAIHNEVFDSVSNTLFSTAWMLYSEMPGLHVHAGTHCIS